MKDEATEQGFTADAPQGEQMDPWTALFLQKCEDDFRERRAKKLWAMVRERAGKTPTDPEPSA